MTVVRLFSAYQHLATSTAIYPGQGTDASLAYLAPGLAAEAGEFAGHYAKAVRDDDGDITPAREAALVKEIGDVLWFVAQIATELGYDLGGIAQQNLDKLASRKERGVLGGSGDNR